MLRMHPDFPNYRVSETGEVYSLGRYGILRLLKQRKKTRGWYLEVQLTDKAGRRRHIEVHRLVCRTFHGEAPAGKPQVRHKDSDPMNNAAGNLAWGSHHENFLDKVARGTHKRRRMPAGTEQLDMLREGLC